MKLTLPTCLLLCLGFIAALTGCMTTHKQDTGLSIELSALERSADGTAKAHLILLNPSVVAYNLSESKHKVYLGGQFAGVIRIKDAVGLAAQNQATMDAVLVPEKGYSLPISGRVTYRLETELQIRIYGDSVEYTKLAGAGTVSITAK